MLLGSGCLLWFVPSSAAAGGVGPYLAAVVAQSARVESFSPLGGGAPELLRNVVLTLYGLFWATLLVGIALLVRALVAPRRFISSPAFAFFALWTLPGLAFYLLVHVGDPGYVLAIVPPLLVAGAAAIDEIVRARRVPAAAVIVPALLLAALQGTLFVFPGPFALSADALAAHDRSIHALVAAARALPNDASLVAAQAAYPIASYYLPERRVRFSGPAPEALSSHVQSERPPDRRTTVLVSADLAGARPPSLAAERRPDGIVQLTVDAGSPLPVPLYDLGLR